MAATRGAYKGNRVFALARDSSGPQVILAGDQAVDAIYHDTQKSASAMLIPYRFNEDDEIEFYCFRDGTKYEFCKGGRERLITVSADDVAAAKSGASTSIEKNILNIPNVSLRRGGKTKITVVDEGNNLASVDIASVRRFTQDNTEAMAFLNDLNGVNEDPLMNAMREAREELGFIYNRQSLYVYLGNYSFSSESRENGVDIPVFGVDLTGIEHTFQRSTEGFECRWLKSSEIEAKRGTQPTPDNPTFRKGWIDNAIVIANVLQNIGPLRDLPITHRLSPGI
jgi:hypothetical protein